MGSGLAGLLHPHAADLGNVGLIGSSSTNSTSQEWGKEWGSPNLTYFLLHHNIDGDEVRAELSLPVRIEDGFITEWEERIILKMPKSEPAVEEVTPPGDEISINVREKEAV